LEVDGIDCFTPLAVAAAWTESMALGTAIANVYTRTASVLAMQAAGLAEAAPGRFTLGLGSSSPVIVQDWGGMRFEDPLPRVREVATALRGLLAGERVTYETERVRVGGLRLSRPVPQPVPLYIAGLRSGMLRLAGQIGDGVIINWLSPGDVPKVVDIAREAAAKAGRDPHALQVVCRIFLVLTDDEAYSRQQARRLITTYLTTPVYEAFHTWLGRGEALGPMNEAWRAGDRRGALAAIPDSVVDDLIVIGNARHCRERVMEYCAAGVTVPILNFSPFAPTGTPGEQSAAALRALAPAQWQ
jgi:probable F420-dependent oxidoreductase